MFHTLDAAYSIYPDADDPTSTSTSSTEAQMSEGNMMVWDLAIACGNGRNVKYKGNLRDFRGFVQDVLVGPHEDPSLQDLLLKQSRQRRRRPSLTGR